MYRRSLVNLLVCGALVTTTMIPAFGVVALVALVLVSLRVLGGAPTRRAQLAWVLAALPSPLGAAAVMFAPVRMWERAVMLLGLVAQWLPLDEQIRWSIVIAIALIPAVYPQTRLAVHAVLPMLHLATTITWPIGWDVAVCVAAGVWIVWSWSRGGHPGLWWAVAVLVCGLNSSAAIAVLPWVLVCALAPRPLLEVLSWWGVVGALASGGYGVLAGLGVVPLLTTLQRVRWVAERRILLVLAVWCMVPVTSSVARLQTSLSVYGTLYSGVALGFADATQRIVAHLPWVAMGLSGVLIWSVWMQWQDEG
jgi:hypothetical protein